MIHFNYKTYIEKNNITIYFYCLSENIEQIKEFNCSKNIIMLPITEIPTNTKIIDFGERPYFEGDIYLGV